MAAPTVYLVTDLRTVPDPNNGGWTCIPHTTKHQSRNGAEERYHLALAEGARSTQYPVFAATLTTNDGKEIYHQAYFHEVQPEPEPEQE